MAAAVAARLPLRSVCRCTLRGRRPPVRRGRQLPRPRLWPLSAYGPLARWPVARCHGGGRSYGGHRQSCCGGRCQSWCGGRCQSYCGGRRQGCAGATAAAVVADALLPPPPWPTPAVALQSCARRVGDGGGGVRRCTGAAAAADVADALLSLLPPPPWPTPPGALLSCARRVSDGGGVWRRAMTLPSRGDAAAARSAGRPQHAAALAAHTDLKIIIKKHAELGPVSFA